MDTSDCASFLFKSFEERLLPTVLVSRAVECHLILCVQSKTVGIQGIAIDTFCNACL